MPRMKKKSSEVAPQTTLCLSQEERALVARLIRVRRSRRYWLRYYIEHLLHMDATTPDELTTEQTQQALDIMKNFVNWVDYFENVTSKNPTLSDFPGLGWSPWNGEEEEDFMELALYQVAEKSLSKKEQLESELREIKANLASPRMLYRAAATDYAQRLDDTIRRIKIEEDE